MTASQKIEIAKEKSIKENRCIKVFKGCYCYKGYEIANDGSNEYPWNYGLDMLCGYECAKTKAEAIKNIDLELN